MQRPLSFGPCIHTPKPRKSSAVSFECVPDSLRFWLDSLTLYSKNTVIILDSSPSCAHNPSGRTPHTKPAPPAPGARTPTRTTPPPASSPDTAGSSWTNQSRPHQTMSMATCQGLIHKNLTNFVECAIDSPVTEPSTRSFSPLRAPCRAKAVEPFSLRSGVSFHPSQSQH